jgi:hypothetical protein
MDFMFCVVLFEGFDFADDSVHCCGCLVDLFLRRGHVASQLFCCQMG